MTRILFDCQALARAANASEPAAPARPLSPVLVTGWGQPFCYRKGVLVMLRCIT